MSKKILILSGSPRKDGNSERLCQQFMAGAESAGHTVENDRLDFTVRYSSETAVVDSKHYRIFLGDRIYNILSIDEMGFKHNSRKIHTELSER